MKGADFGRFFTSVIAQHFYLHIIDRITFVIVVQFCVQILCTLARDTEN